jgi:DNA-binding FadR family transcriptional regulator
MRRLALRQGDSCPKHRATGVDVNSLQVLNRPATTAAPDKMAARLVNLIERDLAAQGWPQGAQIGTEPDLLKKYGVSRAVFREAVRIGEHRGILRMQRGPRGGLIVGVPSIDRVIAACAMCLMHQRVTLREVVAAVRVLAPMYCQLTIERATEEDFDDLASAFASQDSDVKLRATFRTMLSQLPQNPAIEVFVEMFGRVFEQAANEASRFDPSILDRLVATQANVVEGLAEGNGDTVFESIMQYLDAMVAQLPHLADSPMVTVDGLQELTTYPGLKLAEITAQTILQDVVGSDLPAGQMVGSEPELMLRYGVSRAAFREAVRLIEYHQVARMRRGPGGGLVVSIPRMDPVVQTCATFLDYRGVTSEQLLELRTPLELIAIERYMAAAATNPSLMADLDEILDAEVAASYDLPSEQSLHVVIADRSGERTLAMMIRVLAEISDRRLEATTVEPAAITRLLIDSERSHRAVVAAMRAGDLAEAQREMAYHLSFLGPYLS